MHRRGVDMKKAEKLMLESILSRVAKNIKNKETIP